VCVCVCVQLILRCAVNVIPCLFSNDNNINSSLQVLFDVKMLLIKPALQWLPLLVDTYLLLKVTMCFSPQEPSPFDMPDDLTTHSSFNTLEKQNRIRQSENPGNGPPGYGSSNV